MNDIIKTKRQYEYMTVLQMRCDLLQSIGQHLRDLYRLGTDQDQLVGKIEDEDEEDDSNQTYTFTWAAMTGFIPMVMNDISRVMFANCKCMPIEAFFLTLDRLQRIKLMNPIKTTLQIISQNAVQGDKVLVVTVCLHRQQHTESDWNRGFSVTLGYAVVTVPLWLPATDSLSSSENDMVTMTGRTFDVQMDHLQYYSPGRGPILLSVITIFSCLQYLCGHHNCDYTYSVTRSLTTGAVKLALMSCDNPKGNGKEHIMVDGAFVIKHDSNKHKETTNRVHWDVLNVAVYTCCKWCQRWRNVTRLCTGDTWRDSVVLCRYCDTVSILPRAIKIVPQSLHNFLI